MSQLYGLFSNQKDAEQAVNALAEAELDNSAIHTMERLSVDATPVVIPTAQTGPNTTVGAVPLTNFLPDLSIDNDAKQFLKRSLEGGGVLVTVDPADDMAFIQAKRILEQQGGQVLSD
jgi:hypothetical protein